MKERDGVNWDIKDEKWPAAVPEKVLKMRSTCVWDRQMQSAIHVSGAAMTTLGNDKDPPLPPANSPRTVIRRRRWGLPQVFNRRRHRSGRVQKCRSIWGLKSVLSVSDTCFLLRLPPKECRNVGEESGAYCQESTILPPLRQHQARDTMGTIKWIRSESEEFQFRLLGLVIEFCRRRITCDCIFDPHCSLPQLLIIHVLKQIERPSTEKVAGGNRVWWRCGIIICELLGS